MKDIFADFDEKYLKKEQVSSVLPTPTKTNIAKTQTTQTKDIFADFDKKYLNKQPQSVPTPKEAEKVDSAIESVIDDSLQDVPVANSPQPVNKILQPVKKSRKDMSMLDRVALKVYSSVPKLIGTAVEGVNTGLDAVSGIAENVYNDVTSGDFKNLAGRSMSLSGSLIGGIKDLKDYTTGVVTAGAKAGYDKVTGTQGKGFESYMQENVKQSDSVTDALLNVTSNFLKNKGDSYATNPDNAVVKNLLKENALESVVKNWTTKLKDTSDERTAKQQEKFGDEGWVEKITEGGLQLMEFFAGGLGVKGTVVKTTEKLAGETLLKKLGKDLAQKKIEKIGSNTTNVAMTLLESGMEMNDIVEELETQGLSKEEAYNKGLDAFTTNAILIATSNKIDGIFDRNTYNGLKKVFNYGRTALGEGGQEAYQTFISNQATGKPLTEGAGEAFVLGAIIGAGAKAGFDIADIQAYKNTPDQIEQLVAENEAIPQDKKEIVTKILKNEANDETVLQALGEEAKDVESNTPSEEVVGTEAYNTQVDEVVDALEQGATLEDIKQTYTEELQLSKKYTKKIIEEAQSKQILNLTEQLQSESDNIISDIKDMLSQNTDEQLIRDTLSKDFGLDNNTIDEYVAKAKEVKTSGVKEDIKLDTQPVIKKVSKPKTDKKVSEIKVDAEIKPVKVEKSGIVVNPIVNVESNTNTGKHFELSVKLQKADNKVQSFREKGETIAKPDVRKTEEYKKALSEFDKANSEMANYNQTEEGKKDMKERAKKPLEERLAQIKKIKEEAKIDEKTSENKDNNKLSLLSDQELIDFINKEEILSKDSDKLSPKADDYWVELKNREVKYFRNSQDDLEIGIKEVEKTVDNPQKESIIKENTNENTKQSNNDNTGDTPTNDDVQPADTRTDDNRGTDENTELTASKPSETDTKPVTGSTGTLNDAELGFRASRLKSYTEKQFGNFYKKLGANLKLLQVKNYEKSNSIYGALATPHFVDLGAVYDPQKFDFNIVNLDLKSKEGEMLVDFFTLPQSEHKVLQDYDKVDLNNKVTEDNNEYTYLEIGGVQYATKTDLIQYFIKQAGVSVKYDTAVIRNIAVVRAKLDGEYIGLAIANKIQDIQGQKLVQRSAIIPDVEVITESTTDSIPEAVKEAILDKKETENLKNEAIPDKSEQSIEDIVNDLTEIKNDVVVIKRQATQAELNKLATFKSGGITKEGKGVLDEYYTDTVITQAVYDNLLNIKGDVKVLEPSVGLGNFLPTDLTTQVDTYEINPITAKITKLNYPSINVNLKPMESDFVDNKGNKKQFTERYNLIVGNPPYGEHRGFYKTLEEPKITKYEDYFTKKSVDLLEEGGVVAFVLPSGFLQRQSNYAKEQIHKAGGVLVSAYRLPQNAFKGTSIGTDIVIIKKDTTSTAESLLNADDYFKANPNHILGVETLQKNRFGQEETVVKGTIEDAITKLKENSVKIDVNANSVEVIKEVEPTIEEKKLVEKQKVKNKIKIEKVTKKIKEVAKDTTVKQFDPSELIDINTNNVNIPEDVKTHWLNTQKDGSLNPDFKFDPKLSSFYNGKWYVDFNYLQGDIYEKLDDLASTYGGGSISREQYDKQNEALLKILPKPKTLENVTIDPNAQFLKELEFKGEEKPNDGSNYYGDKYNNKKVSTDFISYVRTLPRNVFEDLNSGDIVDYVNEQSVTGSDKARNAFVRGRRPVVAKRLFKLYLSNLEANQKELIMDYFNKNFNNSYVPNYELVPTFAKINPTFKKSVLQLRNAQKGAIGRIISLGKGLVAHDVGFGKTLTSILATHELMHRGFIKKPLFIVPLGTYEQWVDTIQRVIPNVKINGLGNLSAIKNLQDFDASQLVKDGEFNVITHEGFESIEFNADTYETYANQFKAISQDLKEGLSKRQIEKDKAKVQEMKGVLGYKTKANINFERMGIDQIIFDEIHLANNGVTNIKEVNKTEKNKNGDDRTSYKHSEFSAIKTPTNASKIALKTWLASQYIQDNNNGRGFIGLSATPFTNSPVQIFFIMSMFNKNMLKKYGINNVNEFIKTFINVNKKIQVTRSGNASEKDLVTGFKNVSLMRKLLDTFRDEKTGKDAPDLIRPEKQIKTNYFKMTPTQEEVFANLQLAYSGKFDESVKQFIEENNLYEDTKGAKKSVSKLKIMNLMRMTSISPYYLPSLTGTVGKIKIKTKKDGEEEIDIVFDIKHYKKIIESNPKLVAIAEGIKHGLKSAPDSSQIVYTDIGKEILPILKEYLAKEMNVTDVAIINGSVKTEVRDVIRKEFNNEEGSTGKYRVLLGTSAISTGLNLQERTTDLHFLTYPYNYETYAQIEGRSWRFGNKWTATRMNHHLIENSYDVIHFQILAEKQRRRESLSSDELAEENETDDGEIDSNDIAEKAMTDPNVRAEIEHIKEKGVLTSEKGTINANIAFAEKKIEKLVEADRKIESTISDIDRTTTRISEANKNLDNFLSTPDFTVSDEINEARKKRFENDVTYYTEVLKNQKTVLSNAEKNKTLVVEAYREKGIDIDELNTSLPRLRDSLIETEEKLSEITTDEYKQKLVAKYEASMPKEKAYHNSKDIRDYVQRLEDEKDAFYVTRAEEKKKTGTVKFKKLTQETTQSNNNSFADFLAKAKSEVKFKTKDFISLKNELLSIKENPSEEEVSLSLEQITNILKNSNDSIYNKNDNKTLSVETYKVMLNDWMQGTIRPAEIVRTRDGYKIKDGNHRLEAVRQMGLPYYPVIIETDLSEKGRIKQNTEKTNLAILQDISDRLKITFDVKFVDTIFEKGLNIAEGATKDGSAIALIKTAGNTTPYHEFVHLSLANWNNIPALKKMGNKNTLLKEHALSIGDKNYLSDNVEESLALKVEEAIQQEENAKDGSITSRFVNYLKSQIKALGRLLRLTKSTAFENYVDTIRRGVTVGRKTALSTYKEFSGYIEKNAQGSYINFEEGDNAKLKKLKEKTDELATHIKENAGIMLEVSQLLENRTDIDGAVKVARLEIKDYVQSIEMMKQIKEDTSSIREKFKNLVAERGNQAKQTFLIQEKIRALEIVVENIPKAVIAPDTIEKLRKETPVKETLLTVPAGQKLSTHYQKQISQIEEEYGIKYDAESPHYKPQTEIEEVAKSEEFYNANPKIALDVAKGLRDAPNNINPVVLSIVVGRKLLEKVQNENSKKASNDLVTVLSKRSTFLTETAQHLTMARVAYKDGSIEQVLNDVLKARKELANQKFKATWTKLEDVWKKEKSENEVERRRKHLSKNTKKLNEHLEVKAQEIDDFLNALAC